MKEPQTEREPLERLAEEFARRCRKGECPSIAEYTAKHPRLAGQIEDLFPAVAMLEQLRIDERARRQAAFVERRFAGPPPRLGDFDILREIGRGGMGIVYEAEQRSLARRVAVKVLPKHLLLLDKHLRRFQREAQTTARLRHTNVVPVFGVGEQDGLHYYVMPLIRGVGLDEVIRELRKTGDASMASCGVGDSPSGREIGDVVRALIERHHDGRNAERRSSAHCADRGPLGDRWHFAARVGVQAAEALHYAHAQGTLHRDIKPGNLLIDEDGVVCVADFGLARAVDRSCASQTSEVAGTLRYMAPEQLRGAADARSDVYSLGLTLYELLTLQPAFEGPDRKPCLDNRTVRLDPVAPRKIDRAIPRDLETVILKCLAHEPSRRYQTADELAADLQCFLQDRPILARRASCLERAGRWCRRNPALAIMSALAAVLLVTAAATAMAGAIRTRNAFAETTAALARAEATSRLAREALDDIYVQLSPDRVRIPAGADSGADAAGLPVDRHRIRVPASHETALVLENLLEFYDRLAAQTPRNGRVVLESAVASRRVGDIRQRLGQLDRAEREYSRAAAKLASLSAAPDQDVAVQTELARTHNEIGNVRSARFEFSKAHESHRHALSVLQSVPQSHRLTEGYRYELARTWYFLASKRLGAMGSRRYGEADENLTGLRPHYYKSNEYRTSAIRLLVELTREHPNAPDYRFLLALCQRLTDVGPPATRITAEALGRQRALIILSELAATYPDVADYRYELAVTYAAVPVGLFPWEDRCDVVAGAEADLLRALNESQRLVARHPTIPEYARFRSVVLAKMGMVCWRTGRLAEAEGFVGKAITAQVATIGGFPDLTPHHRGLLELMRLRLGQIQMERGDDVPDGGAPVRPRGVLETCIRNLTELTARPELAQDDLTWGSLAMAYEMLSGVLAENGQTEEATAAANRGRAIRTKLNAGRQRVATASSPQPHPHGL